MSVVEITPIVKTLDVGRSAEDAFELFTGGISRWWPLESHARARDREGRKAVAVTIEPKVGGRVYETLDDDTELDWGQVLVFEPGHVFAMEWCLGAPRTEATEVSVRFEPLGDARCRVTLTHDHWERLGEQGAQRRDGYDGGWTQVFDDAFGGFAGRVQAG